MKWLFAVTTFSMLIGVAARGDDLRIGRIAVVSHGLFGDADGVFYRAVNALHSPTREGLIRSFLLFREGDTYDPQTLQESEKNLRALDFIKTATITAGAPHDGVVDVRVETEDEWTSDPSIDFGHSGGVGTVSFNLTQKDILGSGAEISIGSEKGAERSERSLELIHPAFLHPYWNADVLLAKRSDGSELKVELAQPFFSRSTPFSFDFSYDNDTRDDRYYAGGTVASIFRAHNREGRALFGLALPAGEDSAQRVFTGIDYQNIDFGALAGSVLPAPRRYRWALLGYQYATASLTKMNYVDRDERYQDFEIGPRVWLQGGLSPRRAGSDRIVEQFSAQLSDGLQLAPNALLIPRLAFSSRYGAHAENAIGSADVKFVWRPQSRPIQSLVGRVRVEDGRHLDPEVEFFADGMRGLRAYPAFAFAGSRSIMINVEDRLFLGRELLHLFAPGVALFADAGNAGSSSGIFRFAGMKRDVGAGLRIAIPRAESTILRFDLAYPLDPTPSMGRRHVTFSFGTTQAF